MTHCLYCERPTLARGLCNAHYKRQWRRGWATDGDPFEIDKTSWNEITLSYLGGLLDGEGHISKKEWKVRVRMTSPEILEWCYKTFKIGNFSRIESPSTKKKGRKPVYEWAVTRKAHVIELLQATLPYMLCKEKILLSEKKLCQSKNVNKTV